MLAIQYPWEYASVFEGFCDFEVVKCSAIEDTPIMTHHKPVWADLSDRTQVGRFGPGVKGIILPILDDPGRHLLNQDRLKTDGKLNISIWVGDRSHLKLLKEVADVVALHWKAEAAGGPAIGHRSGVITPEEAVAYHAYEFCNLDELRRYPYRSLHTSVPITAAMVGIDLRTRDRRPKRLPEFSYSLQMNDAQLELAYNNCVAIKEAMEYARRNYTAHP